MTYRFENFLSRKFLVFIVATVLLFKGAIGENAWLVLAGVYVGANLLNKMNIFNDTEGTDASAEK